MSSRTLVYKGLLLAHQIDGFYTELADPTLVSALALVHSRYSTNTFPSWDLAHPYRYLCHNGEINTLRGNVNWMNARQGTLRSELFGDDLKKIFPIIRPGGSDSGAFDNALEFLILSGRSLPHAISMMIPEAWEHHPLMDEDRRAYYEYNSCLLEPWDGPASIAFTDGTKIGAVLDRNGLRPSRYMVTKDGFLVTASEVGVLDTPPENVVRKGRLQPGRIFFVDLEQGRIIEDEEIKADLVARRPYRTWVETNRVKLGDLPRAEVDHHPNPETRFLRQQVFGYTSEDLRILIAPMIRDGKEAVGLDGRGRGAGVPVRPSAAALPLLQAALRAGDEPGDRLDPRAPRDVALLHARRGAQPARRDAGARAAAAARSPGDHRRRAGADPEHLASRLPGAHALDDVQGGRGGRRPARGARPALPAGLRGGGGGREPARAQRSRRVAGAGSAPGRCSRPARFTTI